MTGVDWYAARAAGVVAYALLTSGVLLGVLLGGRARLPLWPAFAVTDVHRFISILTGVFIGIHVYALLLDQYAHVSVITLLVPGASSYRPFWLALGTIALELLLAVAISNVLRKRIGHRRWRRVHYLAFGVWIASTAHGDRRRHRRAEPAGSACSISVSIGDGRARGHLARRARGGHPARAPAPRARD